MRVAQGFDYLIIEKDTSHLLSTNEQILQQYENAISSHVLSKAVED